MQLASIRFHSLFLAGLLFGIPAIAADPSPNIVFILADDLGWRDLSNEGSSYYQSPHIDSIAASGMKFTRGYATCQVCSPSRASILTGKYPTKHGITTWIGDRAGEAWRGAKRYDSHLPPEYDRNLRAEEITLAEALHDAGYKTFFAGKWHLGSKGSWPTDHGFEINRGGWDVGSPRGGLLRAVAESESRFGAGRRVIADATGTRDGCLHRRESRSTVPGLSFFLFRSRADPDNAGAMEKISRPSRRRGAGRRAFSL